MVKVVINEPTKTFFCSCKLLETIRILCSHLFAVMKVENITEIPSLMILPRWTKDVKITDRTPSDMCVNVGHYMTEEARIGIIYASCRSLLKYAASSVTAYNVAINDIYNLILKLKAMCQTDKSTGQPFWRSENVINPEIVLIKSSMKISKMGQSQQRKYNRYGVVGHNVRKCKQKIRQN